MKKMRMISMCQTTRKSVLWIYRYGLIWVIPALILLCAFSPPGFAQTRRGLFVTQEELGIWRLRAAGSTPTNYKVAGDVQLNSPNDWARIYFYAEQLRNDTQYQFRWGGPTILGSVTVGTTTYTNAVLKGSDNEPSYPNKLGYQVRDAAFVYLVDKNNPNRQQYRDKVKAELLYYAGLQTLNFSLNGAIGSPLTYPKTYYRDINPSFQIVNFITKLLFAMDFIDAAAAEDGTADWLTPAERESIKIFFQRAADFWVGEEEWDLNRHFTNRENQTGDQLYTPHPNNYIFSTGNTRVPTQRDNLNHRIYCYMDGTTVKEGPLVFGALQSFNNRRAAIYRYGLLFGVKFGVTYHVNCGKQFFKDCIKYSVYPNGAVSELERWLPGHPELGWGYSTDLIASCGTMAEALARTGDNSLYNYSTRLGWESGNSNYPEDHGTVCQTNDPDKSFLLTLKMMKQMINQEVRFYGTNNVNHVETNTWYTKDNAGNIISTNHYNTFIDGYINESSPPLTFRALHDAGWFMVFGNYYANDADVQKMIYRKGENMPNNNQYWANPTSQGVYPVWMGDWGIFPGVGFMFGRIPAQANPYRVNASPNIALNKPTVTSSVQTPSYPGNYAVDGVASTRWSSVFADPQWIYVDLQGTYLINEVKITWEGAFGKDYLIQVSSDAVNWADIKTVVGNTARSNDWTGLSGTGRYLRIYGTARATVYGYSIYELEVYGSFIETNTSSTLRTSTNDTKITEVETKEAGREVHVYPNPATEQVTLRFLNKEEINSTCKISIMDEDAHVLSTVDKPAMQDEIQIDTSILKNGLYFLTVNGSKDSKRIIIKR